MAVCEFAVRRPRRSSTHLTFGSLLTVVILTQILLNKLWQTRVKRGPDTVDVSRTRVISFSLYGDSPRYCEGAVTNSKLAPWVYPGWRIRMYHDGRVPQRILRQLQKHGVDLRDMSDSNINPMSWRFLVASDASVDAYCLRDVDARLTLREYVAVQDWLSSNHKVHIIRDHPGHVWHPMMGGLWCGRREAFPEMYQVLSQYGHAAHFNADQEFLAHQIWSRVNNSALQHVAFGCGKFPGSRPMPLPRVGLEHVGAVYIENQLREEDSRQLLEAIQSGSEC